MKKVTDDARFRTLADLVRLAAELYGPREALAMKTGEQTERWSYSDLYHNARRVAAFLAQRGVTQGDRVVLWAPNQPWWAAIYFGCHLASAVVVPLDINTREDFLGRIEEKTSPKLIFLTRTLAATLTAEHAPLVLLDHWPQLLPPEAPLFTGPEVHEEDIAVLAFTSGTTGRPKGVVLTHRNIVSNVKASVELMEVKPHYRLLSILPLSHMFEQTVGLVYPLTGGGAIVYISSLQPSLIFQALREEAITIILCVPQVLQLFMRGMESEVKRQGLERQWRLMHALARRLPFPLRRLLFRRVHQRLGGRFEFFACGGAYLSPALGQKWENMGIRVLQGYGLTEAAPIVTLNSLDKHKLDSVGRPLPGVEVRIEADGEILVRGENVARGYWQDAEATAQVFADGWLLTGDLGYLDRDGFLHLKGRKKDLIVLPSGLKVYPEDLENALTENPEIADAVVLGLPKPDGDVLVHAVLLTPHPDRAAAIVRATNKKLASHQRIRDFTVWPEEDFPRTHTRKAKRDEILQYLRHHRAELP